mgnify:FL=1
MKQLLLIFTLGASLAGAVNISDRTRPDPVDRSAINANVSRETETATHEATAELTATPMPECPPGDHYDLTLGRCWPDEPPIEIPTETPPWSADIQATMDADPYDNDYQYIGICWEYAGGGTYLIYYPCDATPER